MDKLFQSISENLNATSRIEIYSAYNQHLLDNDNIVLWEKTTTSINIDIYDKLKEALNKRICRFYSLTKVLPYHDFCIALLCSVGYTLNHNTMSSVRPRTFRSAWRNMSIMTGIGDKDVQAWIKDRIQGRDATRYIIALNITDVDSPNAPRKVSFDNQSTKFTTDGDIIAKACSSRNIKEITYDSDSHISTIVNKITGTPEGQLDNLRIIHSELVGGYLTDRPKLTVPKLVPSSIHLQIVDKAGDIFTAPSNTVLIHSCNCRGSWSAGIALQFKARYPGAYRSYLSHCNSADLDSLVGTALLIPQIQKSNHYIGCLLTSREYGQHKDSQAEILMATESAMKMLLQQIRDQILNSKNSTSRINEVWMCKINSGMFGVPWNQTKKVLEDIKIDSTSKVNTITVISFNQ